MQQAGTLERIRPYPIIQVCPTLFLPEIVTLRKQVWDHEGLVRSLGEWRDPLDELAIHFVVKDDDQVIGAARLIILNKAQMRTIPRFAKYMDLPFLQHLSFPFAFFSRLVVAPAYRGQGIARQLQNRRLEFLREHFVPTAILTSQHPSILE
ncbi:MAG: GNAT family N-acetyltransferase, partial [Bacteroidota bacterium]